MAATAVFSLNVHASYRCRHSGACCNAGWSIPVEARIRSLVGTDWLVPTSDSACPQFDRPSGLCRLHRDHGEAMLPESCHHFPRRTLVDGRGIFVTLSHFCPTAAALLLDSDGPLEIIANPPGFPTEREYDGLDALNEWPPLLRPDALFDSESFAAWERYLVHTLGSSDDEVLATLVRVAAAGEGVRQWTAEKGSLLDWTLHALNSAAGGDDEAARRYHPFTASSAFVRVCATVPTGLAAPSLPDSLAESDEAFVAPAWNPHARLVLRYLGAKAFASWTAYQSRGIRTQIAELFLTAAVLRIECVRACTKRRSTLNRDTLLQAIRASDWLLVHLADREALMAWLGEVEEDAPAFPRR